VGRALEADLRRQGHQAKFYTADVADFATAEVVVADVVASFGRLDILVNNAAIFEPATILDMTVDLWDRIRRVNLDAVFLWSKLAAAYMVRQQGGRIINISSVNGFLGGEQSAHYNAAKGGINQLTRCFAVELAPYNIQVNAIAPGFIKTRMSIIDGEDETESEWFQSFYVRRRRIPMARAGRPEEVASAALFLASDDCQYMTGQILVVDGGLTATF
jgi:NAD(P)-dependent dehydrogenase (short-subunit alcohol dehydrogenase family)